jgi:hypothetical protein
VSEQRPAFYALRPGGWRDLVTILHPPYTAWNLANVAFGAAVASEVHTDRFIATLAAFFLAVGISAHALDELNGRPLSTEIPGRVLRGLAAVSIAAAIGIGIGGAVASDLWLLAFVAVGAFVVCAYNLELLGGRLHSDAWFALDWGAFPLLTAYFACAGRLRWEAVLAAAFAALFSYAQRRLSSPVRRLRRSVAAVSGGLALKDGTREPITHETLIAGNEAALGALTLAVIALAVALVLLRV